QEHRPSVLGPARLGLFRAERALLAVRDDGHAIVRDAARGEVVHGALGPPVAKGQVVSRRSALVAVALDQQELIGVLAQPRRVGVEGASVLYSELGFVEVEVDWIQRRIRLEFLRGRWRRSWRRRDDWRGRCRCWRRRRGRRLRLGDHGRDVRRWRWY